MGAGDNLSEEISTDRLNITGITTAQIASRSFGMDDDEATARAVFVLVKREKNNPRAEDIYMLTYRDRDAAFENCRTLNNLGGTYLYKVRSTHFSGPM
jgi:hypothetical protein